MAGDWIVFIDTNVLLDFYRQGGESVSRQTQALIKHKERIITGDQVRMEFLKNRQIVIKQGSESIPKTENFTPPAMVAESQPAGAVRKRLAELNKFKGKLKKRFSNILEKPAQYDPVYKAVNKIFDHKGPNNLSRPGSRRFYIRNLARKRFILGYPPRKSGDNSIGDALNWEWIIDCATKSPNNTGVLIVTRDEDFGVYFNKKMYLNDWLYREFRDRVSRKKPIEITAKLSDAIKMLDEVVNQEDEKVEEQIVEMRMRRNRAVHEGSPHITNDQIEAWLASIEPLSDEGADND
ncbi:PIN domain-containing protein [Hyphobacterium sp. SN044]|uniref:PIN domain-containing protein n=1 Tax=Hyphobacterium sp. SN044 TaxID=2912575 RepID=UPI001F480C8C|nr:PIN domain-containing protein [Hyphobacterium sp. SN044]MCF8879648.1 PIN domain-containing protein [Hyphobacterium sp. SN044]